MKRLLMRILGRLVAGRALTAGAAAAEVKTRDKGQVKFEGMLGRMMGMFGGKAVKDGVVIDQRRQGQPQGRR